MYSQQKEVRLYSCVSILFLIVEFLFSLLTAVLHFLQRPLILPRVYFFSAFSSINWNDVIFGVSLIILRTSLNFQGSFICSAHIIFISCS